MKITDIPSDRLLGVFAKQPRAGHAKTRLAQATSPPWAERVAQAMLEDSLDRFSPVEAIRAIVYAPADATAFFSQLAHGRYELMPQTDGDLGQRVLARRRRQTKTEARELPVR